MTDTRPDLDQPPERFGYVDPARAGRFVLAALAIHYAPVWTVVLSLLGPRISPAFWGVGSIVSGASWLVVCAALTMWLRRVILNSRLTLGGSPPIPRPSFIGLVLAVPVLNLIVMPLTLGDVRRALPEVRRRPVPSLVVWSVCMAGDSVVLRFAASWLAWVFGPNAWTSMIVFGWFPFIAGIVFAVSTMRIVWDVSARQRRVRTAYEPGDERMPAPMRSGR